MSGYYKPDGTLDSEKLAMEPLHFFIDSPGGRIQDKFHITETMENLKKRGLKIITYVNDMAASAAASIFAHGTERVISKAGLLLLHEVQTSSGFRSLSQVKEKIRFTENLNALSLRDVFDTLRPDAPNHPKDFEQFCKLLQVDQIYTADDAINLGIADRIGVYDDIRYNPTSIETESKPHDHNKITTNPQAKTDPLDKPAAEPEPATPAVLTIPSDDKPAQIPALAYLV